MSDVKKIILVPPYQKEDQTETIQNAIDECRGEVGRIIFMPGKYYTGTIRLCSRLTLELLEGSEIVGSEDLTKYTVREYCHQSKKNYWQSIFYAQNETDISVEGGGKISGQGDKFPFGLEAYSVNEQELAPVKEYMVRPSLIYFKGCQNIKLENLTLADAAQFAVLAEECRGISFRNVNVHNRKNQNTDGFHFSWNRDILVDNCKLDCGDDAIVLNRSAVGVKITNCRISSRWAGIRIGPFSDGEFSRIEVANCIIHDTYGCAIKIQIGEGGHVRDAYFHDLDLEHVTGPVQIRLCHFPGWESVKSENSNPGSIERVVFERIKASVTAVGKPKPNEVPLAKGETYSCVHIQGLEDHKIGRVEFLDCDIQYEGGYNQADYVLRLVENIDYRYPEYFIFGIMPCYALYAAYIKALKLERTVFSTAKKDVRAPMVLYDIMNTQICDMKIEDNRKDGTLVGGGC